MLMTRSTPSTSMCSRRKMPSREVFAKQHHHHRGASRRRRWAARRHLQAGIVRHAAAAAAFGTAAGAGCHGFRPDWWCPRRGGSRPRSGEHHRAGPLGHQPGNGVVGRIGLGATAVGFDLREVQVQLTSGRLAIIWPESAVSMGMP